jgi:CBS domain containing-hemolysin-like protein
MAVVMRVIVGMGVGTVRFGNGGAGWSGFVVSVAAVAVIGGFVVGLARRGAMRAAATFVIVAILVMVVGMMVPVAAAAALARVVVMVVGMRMRHHELRFRTVEPSPQDA